MELHCVFIVNIVFVIIIYLLLDDDKGDGTQQPHWMTRGEMIIESRKPHLHILSRSINALFDLFSFTIHIIIHTTCTLPPPQ